MAEERIVLSDKYNEPCYEWGRNVVLTARAIEEEIAKKKAEQIRQQGKRLRIVLGKSVKGGADSRGGEAVNRQEKLSEAMQGGQ